MTAVLVRKLLRDFRWPLLGVAIFLAGFECLWVKITQRITGQLVPLLLGLAQASKLSAGQLETALFEGPGKIMRTMMGGESIELDRAMDMLSIGFVHPTVQAILCIWAVGRSAGALAGEIDRGTMELLMAQPVRRYQLVLSYLVLDLMLIPLLCLAMWGGTFLGVWLVGPISLSTQELKRLPFPVKIDPAAVQIDAWALGPSLFNTGALLFAISGFTIWLSSRGRARWKVLGVAISAILVQFLINVLGQLWDAIAVLRPFTVFYYYQPQQIALKGCWTVDLGIVWNNGFAGYSLNVIVVLMMVGVIGYGMAFWTFCRRDLPAPL
jgi:ABC-2 type transport system permease protein